MSDPQKLRELATRFIQTREAFTKRAQGSDFQAPQKGIAEGIKFIEQMSAISMEVAKELQLGHELAIWESFSELVNNHLSNLRSAQDPNRKR